VEGLGYGESSLYAQSVRRGLCVWMTPHGRRRLAVAPRGGDGRASRAPRRMSVGGPAEVASSARGSRSATPPTERERGICNFQALYLRTLGSMGEAGLACHVCGVCAAAPPPASTNYLPFSPAAARAVTRGRGAVRLRGSVGP